MSIADKLVAIAANEPRVYEAGQQAAHDHFWDVYQNYGKRTSYFGAFAGRGWNNELLKPKYSMMCTGNSSEMFYNSVFVGDLANWFTTLGVTWDVSKATSLRYLFSTCANITRVGRVDITAAGSSTANMFSYCGKLHTIDALVVRENNTFSGCFTEDTSLKNLTIIGKIASSMDLHWSPLSRASIQSVMDALSDTAKNGTLTLNAAAVTAAFTTQEWAGLVASKPNWTIKTT